MKSIILFLLGFSLASCSSNDEPSAQQIKNFEAMSNPESLKPITVKEEFKVNNALVKKLFLQYLPDISEGRTLNLANDGEGFTIAIGDLNGDNLNDAIVDYSLTPTVKDNGGGNSIAELPGIIAFLNTGTSLVIADHSENFTGDLKKINNGVIIMKNWEYADDDPRCCPSIEKTDKIVLRNNKLTEL